MKAIHLFGVWLFYFILMNRFKIAGAQFANKEYGYAIKTLAMGTSYLLNSNSYSRKNFWLFGGKTEILFDFTGNNSIIKAYEQCPPIFAILNYQVNCYINGITTITNTKGEISTSDRAKRINKLRQKPNPIQTEDEFDAQGLFYKRLFGYNVVWCGADFPIGFDRTYAKQLWNIPPNLIEFRFKQKPFWEIDFENEEYIEVWLKHANRELKLNKGSYYIFKGNSPNFNEFYLPETPIKSLEKPINNTIGAYESRYSIIKNRGALGLISSDAKDATGSRPLSVKEKEDLQEDYKTQYGLSSTQWSTLITSQAVKYQQMGFPTKDLLLFEEIEEDMQRICDAFGHQYSLLANNNTNSLGGNKLNESKKLLYQDTIIPLANSDDKQWMEFFGITDLAETIKTDYSHVPALQEDELKNAQARKTRNEASLIEFKNNIITYNQWLNYNKLPIRTDEFGTMYYYQLLSKGLVFGDVPNQTNLNIQNQVTNE